MSVVIHHKELGVYLGSCLGLGFWSALDPCGQDAAVCFPTEDDAKKHVASWDDPPEDVEFCKIQADRGHYASIDACVKAGLAPWSPAGVQ